MFWTQIEQTPMAQMARAAYLSPDRKYHGMNHIDDMFLYAGMYGVPYDVELDKAIWAHDVILDGLGQHERRSADWLEAVIPGSGKACKMIMTTEEHRLVNGDNHLVFLDLAGFICEKKRHENLKLVFDEMKKPDDSFGDIDGIYKNILSYLEGLHDGLVSDLEFRSDINYREQFEKIVFGIKDIMKTITTLYID